MTPATPSAADDHRRGWLVVLGQQNNNGNQRGVLGAGETIPSARADARERCYIVESTLPAHALVLPCTLAELDAALVLLRERPRVGRLARHPVVTGDHPHFRIMGADVPAANRADVRSPIAIGWDPWDPASNLHGRPLFPNCPDCSRAIRTTNTDSDPATATLECAHCGSLYHARGLHTPAADPPRPGPEDVALMRRQAAEICEAAAAHLRRQADARAQSLVVDARRTIQKLRARLAHHDLHHLADAIRVEHETSPPAPDTTPGHR